MVILSCVTFVPDERNDHIIQRYILVWATDSVVK
jgi:hypothetical protein